MLLKFGIEILYKELMRRTILKSSSSNAILKRNVGIKAVDYVEDGMLIGVGTGSTVAFFIEGLSNRVRKGLKIKVATTSYSTRILCARHNIPLIDTMLTDHLDLAVDGADEIDPSLNAIKGGGAAHTIEKLIASMADDFILIADHTKFVPNLLSNFPLPVEVIPSSLSFASKRIIALGGEPKLRTALRKDGPIISENDNFILDITFKSTPKDLIELDTQLKAIPGLLETGLFLGLASKALIGYEDKVKEIQPKR